MRGPDCSSQETPAQLLWKYQQNVFVASVSVISILQAHFMQWDYHEMRESLNTRHKNYSAYNPSKRNKSYQSGPHTVLFSFSYSFLRLPFKRRCLLSNEEGREYYLTFVPEWCTASSSTTGSASPDVLQVRKSLVEDKKYKLTNKNTFASHFILLLMGFFNVLNYLRDFEGWESPLGFNVGARVWSI